MTLDTRFLLSGSRDPKKHTANCRALRALPERLRIKTIREVLDKNVVVGLKLASKTINDKRFFKEILDRGLETADASGILLWLECVIPRLGVRRVLRILQKRLQENPVAVAKALYWVPRFISEDNVQHIEMLQSLIDSLAAIGVRREPIITQDPARPGIFLFGDIDSPDKSD